MACYGGRSFVIALATALTLIAAPSADALPSVGGSAHYHFKVVDFSYKGTGDITAAHNDGFCDPGVTAAWVGHVDSATTEGALTSGKGSLHILFTGSKGSATGHTQADSNLVNTSHTLVTECTMGQQTAATTTLCSDTELTPIQAHFGFKAALGDRVSVTANLRAEKQTSGWIEDDFSCVAPLKFPEGTGSECAPKILPLSKFTAKTVKLSFRCADSGTQPPFGTGATEYSSLQQATGFIRLKRTKQSGGK